jgi:hypothetical protein
MQHAFGMRRGESRAQLARDLGGLVRGQASDAAQQAAEVFAIDVLHGDERGAFRFPDVVHAANVRMRDLAGDADLAVEAFEQAGLIRHRLGQELERHRLIELEVGGAVDLAHASATDDRDDAVAFAE